FEVGGEVWVETRRTTGQPVAELAAGASRVAASGAAPTPTPAPASTPAQAPATPVPPPPRDDSGRVLEREAGSVVVDLGTANGLALGSRVAFPREDGQLTGDGASPVVGEVVSVLGARARVRIGFGEQ